MQARAWEASVTAVTPDPEVQTRPYAEELKGGAASVLSLFRFADAFDRLLIFIGVLASLAHGALIPVMTLLLGDMIDNFGGGSDSGSGSGEATASAFFSLDSVSELSLKMLWFGLGSGVSALMQVWFLSVASARQAHRIRHRYFSSALSQEIGFHDMHPSGELTTRVSSLQAIQDATGAKLGSLLQNVASMVAGVVVAFSANAKVAAVLFSTVPVFFISGACMGYTGGSYMSKMEKAFAFAGTVAGEAVSGIRTIVAFGGERRELASFTRRLRPTVKIGISLAFGLSAALGVSMCMLYAVWSIASGYGSQLIADSETTAGSVVTALFAVMIGSQSMGQISSPLSSLFAGQGAAGDIFALIDRQSLVDPESAAGRRLDRVQGSIEFRNVHFSYPTRSSHQVLNGLDLFVPAGKTVALVGASGCGKSTVVGLLERFYIPSLGEILLDGTDIAELNTSWLRTQIGIVTQEPVLFSGTIEENISHGKPGGHASQDEIIAAAKLANAHDFISALPDGYKTVVGNRGTQLSGGQKQRVAIARAIIRNPPVLLLDEATSALDTESERVVQHALESASRSRTTLVIAHRLSTIRSADIIVVISGGVVVEQGTHDDLISRRGAYFNLVERQKISSGGRSVSPDASASAVTPVPVAPSPTSAEQQQQPRPSSEGTKGKGALSSKPAQEEVDRVTKWPFLRILKMSIADPGLFFVGLLCAIVNGAVTPFISLLFSKNINLLLFAEGAFLTSEARRFALYIFALAIVNGLSMFGYLFLLSASAERLTFRVRVVSLRALLRQDLAWFDRSENRPGEITTKLYHNSMSFQRVCGDTLGTLLQVVSLLVVALVISLSSCWQVALLAIACVPLIMLGAIVDNTVQYLAIETLKRAYEKSGGLFSEALENVRTVASFGLETRLMKSFHSALLKPHRRQIVSTWFMGFAYFLAELGSFGINALCFWFGARLLSQGQTDVESMLVAVFVITDAAVNLGHISSWAPNYAKVKAAALSLFRILDRRPQVVAKKQSETELSSADGCGALMFENVHFRYPQRRDVSVLTDFNLAVPPGKTVALVGASGSGKSTVVSLLERFYNIEQGRITLDGVDTSEIPLHKLRSMVGYVSQEPILFTGTIRENIAFGHLSALSTKPLDEEAVDALDQPEKADDPGPEIPMEEIIAAAKLANAHDFISALPDGYETQVGENGAQLSGGQKQRIAIARAIIRKPRILALDEATSALDTESERVVQAALDQVRVGRTTLVIAHRLSTIQSADSIAVLVKGVIVEQGTHEELLALGGIYRNMVEHQQVGF